MRNVLMLNKSFFPLNAEVNDYEYHKLTLTSLIVTMTHETLQQNPISYTVAILCYLARTFHPHRQNFRNLY